MAARTRRFAYTLTLLLITAIVVMTGYKNRARPEPTLKDAFPYGEIRIGVDASFPPFAVDNGQTMYGADIDLGNALGKYFNVPVRFVNIGYDALYDAVTTDKVDMLISALLVSPLKTNDVHYSRHYFDNGLMLVSAADSPFVGMETLPGFRLAYEFGGTADNEARLWSRRIAAFETRPYELPDFALDAVRVGDADAALVDNTSYRLYLREHPDWQTQTYTVTNSFYAIAVDIDRTATYKFVNDAVWVVVADGTLDEILRKWL
jgi:polar amino acid transport system substrate-binding protein